MNADVAEFRVSGGQISQQATAMKERDYLLEKARKEAKRAVDGGADFRDELSHRFGGAFFKKLYEEDGK